MDEEQPGQQAGIAGDAIGQDKTVHGDEVRGDKVGGDKVIGPKIVYQAPPPRIPLQRPPRAAHFTGRQRELAHLLAALQPGQAVTLCGPGGIGKSALAAEALWTLAPAAAPPARFPDGIVYHDFYTQPQAAVALEAIARAYGEDPRPTPQDAARRALAGRTALLVLDGAENADDLRPLLDVRGSCGVLIASRAHRDAVADWQDIPPLPHQDAVRLLQAWAGERAADPDVAGRICRLVGDLPLAVRLAGRYLAQRGQQAAVYLEWLQDSPLQALDQGRRRQESVPLLLARSLAQVSEGARAALSAAGALALAPWTPPPSPPRWSCPPSRPTTRWASWWMLACSWARMGATWPATPWSTPTSASAARCRQKPLPGWTPSGRTS